ncbi:MAG TPA: tetratricopeptide repeat protein [Spirochaetota bacterium]|nr:tetratricopeptide repeat protein [Spirochaetota bacterium]
MANIKKKNTIEIERNPIEKFLMSVKDFSKNNRRKVITVSISVILILIISLAAYVLLTGSSEKQLIKFEQVIDSYRSDPMNQEVKDKTIVELQSLISDTKFGFVHEMSYYFLGNIFFTEKKYSEAYSMFEAFIKKSSDDVFVPIAVNKTAICLEEQGKIDEAITLLNKYESDNSDSIAMDQIYYNSARLYSLKNNQIKAREYFNSVIAKYPESIYAERSRERLLLLSAVK